jgi:hypothetical protein
MISRSSARLDDALYAAGGRVRVHPVQLGDRVRLYGDVGVVTAIDLSLASSMRIVTVELDPRIRLRVAERDIEPL